MNISETGGPIAIKFYVKHHFGRRKVAFGFGTDRFRTLVSMATYSSHRVIMGGNGVANRFSRLFFIRSFSSLQITMTCMRARRSSKSGAIRPLTAVKLPFMLRLHKKYSRPIGFLFF